MRSRAKLICVALIGGLTALAGCGQDQPTAMPSSSATESDPATEVTPSGDASGAAGGIAEALDMGALQERRDPERLLRFYISAIRVGDWDSAAKAWSLDAQMTPEKLRSEFGGDVGPKIALGKGDSGGAAGSLYYEAPVTIAFSDDRESRRGTIVLHRANDVPGASELQLLWRIERSSIQTL